MAIVRRDDTVTDTRGNAISCAAVFYLTQPANTDALTPQAPIYSNTSGTPETQPRETNGYGHAWAYLNDGQLYTIVFIYPNGTKVIYPDQFVGNSPGQSGLFAGVPVGTIDGFNRVFTLVNGTTPLTAIPSQSQVWLNYPLVLNVGYTLSIVSGQAKITYTTLDPPQPGDTLFAQGIL